MFIMMMLGPVSFISFFYFQNSIRAHVRHRALATLQIVVPCSGL